MIAVIGARFTGKYVVAELAEAGESVCVFARNPEQVAPRINSGIQIYPFDLDGPPTELPRVDCVVSTAPIQMAASVVDLCQRIETRRVVFVSSTWRHSRAPTEAVNEVIRGEEAVMSSGLDWTILRPTMIYGPGDRNVSILRERITRSRVLPIIGSGERLVQPVFVKDVAAAVSSAVSRRGAVGQCFEVCGPEPMTYSNMVDEISRSVRRHPLKVYVPISIARRAAWLMERSLAHPPVTLDQVRRMAEDRHFDIRETAAALGYFPRSFSDGLLQTAAAG
jgi:nucleoside-diphosphate-sugar epimerase